MRRQVCTCHPDQYLRIIKRHSYVTSDIELISDKKGAIPIIRNGAIPTGLLNGTPQKVNNPRPLPDAIIAAKRPPKTM